MFWWSCEDGDLGSYHSIIIIQTNPTHKYHLWNKWWEIFCHNWTSNWTRSDYSLMAISMKWNCWMLHSSGSDVRHKAPYIVYTHKRINGLNIKQITADRLHSIIRAECARGELPHSLAYVYDEERDQGTCCFLAHGSTHLMRRIFPNESSERRGSSFKASCQPCVEQGTATREVRTTWVGKRFRQLKQRAGTSILLIDLMSLNLPDFRHIQDGWMDESAPLEASASNSMTRFVRCGSILNVHSCAEWKYSGLKNAIEYKGLATHEWSSSGCLMIPKSVMRNHKLSCCHWLRLFFPKNLLTDGSFGCLFKLTSDRDGISRKYAWRVARRGEDQWNARKDDHT